MTDKDKLIKLQAQLAELRSLGVFHLVPAIEERDDGYGQLLVFRKRDNVVCDPDIRFKRYVSLPQRDEEKREKLLEKLGRTKQAAKLVKEIDALIKRTELSSRTKLVQAQAHKQAAIWQEIAKNLRQEAKKYESKASAVLAHA